MRQFLFPAILALTLHGLLFGIGLPHRTGKPMLRKEIPVEIALRQEVKKTGPITKATALKPRQKQAEVPALQPREEKKTLLAPVPPRSVVEKKTAPPKSAAFAPPKKESTIEKKREPWSPPPATPAQDTEPAWNQAPPAVTADNSAPAEASAPAEIPAAQETTAGRRMAVPAYERNRQPEYPRVARRRGYSGMVMLRVLVDVDGQVADLAVEKSSGHRILDRAALEAVEQWLFAPATENDLPVPMWVMVPVVFRLQD